MQSTLTIHQERWEEILHDPSLGDLPYKVETNAHGQIILSPHTTLHSRQQKAVIKHLDRLITNGESFPEYPVSTSGGVKQPDVIWASDSRQAKMGKTGDPPTLAPEICVEIMSPTNSETEMEEKRRLYLDAGAQEVWIVSESGDVRFFAQDRIDRSDVAPDFPTQIDV